MKDDARSLISRASDVVLRTFGDVWLVWLALAIVTTLPYILAMLRTPAGHTFTGVLGAYDDTFTYFAWIRQSADGHVLLRDLFTSEPQPREFFLPLWSLIGFAARVTGASVAVMFHIARLLAALLLLMAARTTALMVMKSRTRVRYTLWLYAMSSGLGWLVYAVRNRTNLLGAQSISGSVDLTMPEAIAFRSVFGQVHFAIGAALVAYAIRFFIIAIAEKQTGRAFTAGLLVSLLALVHPYLVVVVVSVAIVSILIIPWLKFAAEERPSFLSIAKIALVFGAASLPGIGYLLYLSRTNEVLREWLRITDTLSPAPHEYLLGFGICAALAVVGFRLLWNSRATYGRLLLIWTLVQAALLYAPVSFQRRLVEGLQLPLVLAASVAVFWIAQRFLGGRASRYRKAYLAAVIVISSITNIGFIVGQVVANGNSISVDSRRYVPDDLRAAFEYVRTHADANAVLFSHYLTGNLAPSATGLRVFLGHYGQTIDADEKGTQVTAFYAGAFDDTVARELFAKNEVRYVFYGPFERASYAGFVPPRWMNLASRFGNVDVYEVDR